MNRRALETKLDANKAIRAKLKERITKAIENDKIPVAVLHQLVQCIDLWAE